MAKLTMKSTTGFNAERNHEPKKVRLDSIVIDQEISEIFDIQVRIKDNVLKSILNRGYDPEQPITLWNNILVDGRTRYTAAKEAGLEEIFAFEREFASREDAVLYAFARQAIRRNLSAKEILKAAQMIPDVRRQKGQGRIAEEIAQTLNVSPSTIYQARRILKEAAPEDIEAIENGETSFKSVNKKLSKKADEEKPISMKKPDVKIIIEWLTEELRLQTIWAEKRLDDEKEQGYLHGLKRALSYLTNKEYPILHCISQDMPENESALLVQLNVPKRQDKEGI
jgi:DNA-binding CsgD family transcriptional regulator